MADAKGPALPVEVENLLREAQEVPLGPNDAKELREYIRAQAARIKELEAERDKFAAEAVDRAMLAEHKVRVELRARAEAAEARCEALEAACRRQVENIERWQETGEPAGPEESRSIYAQLRAALRAAGE